MEKVRVRIFKYDKELVTCTSQSKKKIIDRRVTAIELLREIVLKFGVLGGEKCEENSWKIGTEDAFINI